MRSLPILSSAILAPGGLQLGDLMAGASAVERLSDECPVHVGAPVDEPLPTPDGFPAPYAPRALLLALAAGQRLLIESGPRYGLVVALSSLHSEPRYLEHSLRYRDDPAAMGALSAYRGDFALNYLAAALRIDGPRIQVDTACASGSDALILGHQWIESGYVEDVIVLAASSMLNPIGLALFRNLHALSEDDDLAASRPFDRRRNGFVMGEGAAALWLSGRQPETPLAYLVSYGQTMNAFKLTDLPDDPSAMVEACRLAIADFPRPAYVSAHGTSTPGNDRIETQLYKKLFGRHAYDIPISSLKSMTGHCLGASSLLEIVVAIEALRRRQAPPTLNLIEPDADCDLDYVPLQPRPINGDFALSNAFAFGGHNSAVLLAGDQPR